MKKPVLLIVILVLSLLLSGCESSDVKKAKECIDDIYKYTNEMTAYQIELAGDPNNFTAKRMVTMYETFLVAEISVLESTYKNLSAKDQEKVANYVAEAGYRNIIDIWN